MAFKVLEARTSWTIIGKIWIVRAQDLKTKFVVTARFNMGVPSIERIVEGLQYALEEAVNRDKFFQLEGETIGQVI